MLWEDDFNLLIEIVNKTERKIYLFRVVILCYRDEKSEVSFI